jgi:hypothetical protein
VFVSDQLCDTNQWRGFVDGKTVKEVGLSQLQNLVAAIVGKCNMAERSPPTDPSTISFRHYLKDPRMQMSLAYKNKNKMQAVLKVIIKCRKSSDAEETYVVIDDKVSEIYSGIIAFKPATEKYFQYIHDLQDFSTFILYSCCSINFNLEFGKPCQHLHGNLCLKVKLTKRKPY